MTIFEPLLVVFFFFLVSSKISFRHVICCEIYNLVFLLILCNTAKMLYTLALLSVWQNGLSSVFIICCHSRYIFLVPNIVVLYFRCTDTVIMEPTISFHEFCSHCSNSHSCLHCLPLVIWQGQCQGHLFRFARDMALVLLPCTMTWYKTL